MSVVDDLVSNLVERNTIRLNGAFTGAPQVNDYGAVVGASWTLN